jgi:SPP1 gp7 family putative phage head morphogenesis protein
MVMAMATETTPYKKTDKTITYLNKQYGRMFRKTASFDALNIIDISHEIYEEAYQLAEQEAIRLVESVYGSYRRDEEVAPGAFDPVAFVLAMVLAYNPVTKYVFKNEIDRKRARFAESMLASTTPAEEVALAKRLLAATNAQFMDDVTFESLVQAYKDNGAEKVQWVTAVDDRRCRQCAALHGKIFPIDKIPPKPHIHCRCWVREVINDS